MQYCVSARRIYRVYWLGLFGILNFPLYADIVTDGTVGPAQTLNGPAFAIPESLGSRAGANLFHSFQRFNIANGEQATFTGSASIANVISRVTGGQISNIDGLLRSTIGQADFYFLNPAGVVFGSNAQIDVPGSFYVSTANELRFADGSVYSATNPPASKLTIDQPEAFGFLGDQTASISLSQSNLVLTPGNTLSVSAGELVIDNARLTVDRGEVQFVSVGNFEGTVTMDGAVSDSANGSLNISQSRIDVSGDGAGRLVVRSGSSSINSSDLFADSVGPTHPIPDKGIDIEAKSLRISNSLITADTFSQGQQGADVNITVADKLSIVEGGLISSTTFTQGNAGDVMVSAGGLIIDEQDTGRLTGIVDDVERNAQGDAGSLTVKVTGQLSIFDGGIIRNNMFGRGNAGPVVVEAGNVTIDSQGSNFFTGIFSNTFGSGDSGDVTVSVTENLSILDKLAIIASRSGTSGGSTGNVIVKAGNLTVDGQDTRFLTGIVTTTFSNENAGNVTISIADTLNVFNSAEISSSTFSQGNAGTVSVKAGNLNLDGKDTGSFTLIGSSSQRNSTGDAGNVVVNVTDTLNIISGSDINTTTFSAGRAGFVKISTDQLRIVGGGQNPVHDTGIFSNALVDSSGLPGNVSITANDIVLTQGGEINIESLPTVDIESAAMIQPTEINITAENITLIDSFITTESFGNIPAGSINLNVADTLSLDPSRISTAANNADGGDISIRAKVIDLQDSQFTTSVSGQGDGGDIDLDTNTLVLDSGFIQANTGGINAQGGDIRINTNALVASNNNLLTGGDTPFSFQPGLNVIQAAAPDGVSGSIDITTPQLDISGELIDLDSALVNVDDLAQNPCATTGTKQSTLVSLGRGGLLESPEQAGSIVITPERLQRLPPVPEPVTDPQSESRTGPAQSVSLYQNTHPKSGCLE